MTLGVREGYESVGVRGKGKGNVRGERGSSKIRGRAEDAEVSLGGHKEVSRKLTCATL